MKAVIFIFLISFSVYAEDSSIETTYTDTIGTTETETEITEVNSPPEVVGVPTTEAGSSQYEKPSTGPRGSSPNSNVGLFSDTNPKEEPSTPAQNSKTSH